MKALTWKKILILGALILAPFMMAGCGESESVASNTAGPAGPTYPNGYFFDVTITPHTIMTNSTVSIMVRVWDSNGNPAGGVAVMMSGSEKADENNFATTADDGLAWWVFEVKAPSGAVFPITITVESSSLTVPLQVIPASGATSQ